MRANYGKFIRICIVFVLGVFAFAATAASPQKVLMVVPMSKIADIEYTTVRKALDGIGADVSVASVGSGYARGYPHPDPKDDLQVLVDVFMHHHSDQKWISELVAPYEMVVFIGGEGVIEQLWDSPSAQLLARTTVEKGKLLAAICAAPVVLARAGVLKNIQATVYPDLSAELTKEGARYVNETVVEAGKIITGRNPDASDAFAAKLVEVLKHNIKG